MTDKVQKIREEVERLRSLHQMKYQQLDADNSMSLVECGKRNLCNELLSFIDSLQEEHASIWHYASEKPERDDLLIETNDGRIIHRQSINNYGMVKRWAYTSDLLNLDNSCNFGNNSQEEPVGNDLGDYINELSKQFPEVSFAKLSRIAVRVAKWQKENLWKPADGDDLPIIDREVIALIDNGKVVFAHRPDHKGWDSKSIITEKIEHYTPETYDKGGWNQPNVKWWLDVDKLPNMEG